jgi:pre-mRNA-processing factor SLU7
MSSSSSATSFKKRQEDAQKKQNGEMAPDIDGNSGKMINPHNPDFITKVPWYLGNSGPTLKHHSVQKSDHVLSMTESDQLIKQKINSQKQIMQDSSSRLTYRKGACKNCGAMTHKEKDCVERPRSSKKAAWKSGLDIAPDEVSLKFEEHGKVSYSAKRDQWQGYDAEQYAGVVDRFKRQEEQRKQQMAEEKEQRRKEDEEARKARKEEKARKRLENAEAVSAARSAKAKGKGMANDGEEFSDEGEDKTTESSDSDSDSDYDSDEDDDDGDRDFLEKDEDARDFQGRMARQGGVGGAEMKVTTRNLRIREDTPKYLRNLDLDSAHYDPKSRSMRANPFPNENPENLPFAGDNFVRHSGDSLKLAQTQVLCWEMQEHGQDVDVLSNPSQAELMHAQIQTKKKTLEDSKRQEIIDKYGAGKSLKGALDPRLRLGQTEAYTEYSWDGRVVKGAGKAVPKSKYEEDVFCNNHTSVWGSYYSRARMCWGYACCHSLMRNSYCTGEAGRAANDNANSSSVDANMARQMVKKQEQDRKERGVGGKDEKNEGKDDGKTLSSGIVKRSDVYGDASGSQTEFDKDKLAEALARQDDFKKQDHKTEADDRRRSFNSMKASDVTEVDMEAYRMKKSRRDDPMAAFVDDEDTQ